MSLGILQRFVLSGEGHFQILQLNVRDADSLRMTATAIPEMHLRAIPTDPHQESIAVQECLLIGDLEGQVLVPREMHLLNPRWRVQ